MRFTKYLLLLTLFSFSQCTFDSTPQHGASASGNGLLYVVDNLNDTVFVYEDLESLSGDVTATRSITGSNTLISSPTQVAVDSTRDYLYVADTSEQAILVFSPASSSNGNTTPKRSYAGLKRAGAMYYDLSNDRLYVTDVTDQAIKIWDGIRNLTDGTEATRSILLGYVPSAMFVNVDSDEIYVADPASALVKVYTNASTVESSSVELAADRSFSNGTTDEEFVNLDGLAMNTDNDILFVSESEHEAIDVFTSASTLSGSEESARRVVGDATTLTRNAGALLFHSNTLYSILDENVMGVWDNANTVDGDTAPTRTINLTDVENANSFAVDFTH